MLNDPMPIAVTTTDDAPVTATTLGAKLTGIFACPGDVFEEVCASPHQAGNWLAPVILVSLAGAIPVFLSPTNDRSGDQTSVAMLAVILSAWVGTFWSAFVIWLIGRVFLKTRFPFPKAVEVAGLASMILVLNILVTSLLILVTNDATVRPALSLFARDFDPANRIHATLAVLDFFHFWAGAVLAAGLSKLTGVTLKEAAFWTFGYWLALPLAIGWA